MHIVSTAPSLTVVTFRVAGAEFALSADRVRDTLVHVHPTRVPGAADCYDGILSWRGQIVPVLNVARRLGLEPGSGDAVVLIDAEGEWVALRVDDLVEEQPIALEALEPPAPKGPASGPEGSAPDAPAGYTGGVGFLCDRRVTILEASALLAPPTGAVSAFLSKPDRPAGRPAGNGRRGVKRA
jgi:purine-binding chemotaxis protein CheW